ncbi:MAG: ABC transporter ATP-binding protein [Phycisphaerales bacterium]
MTAQPGLVTGLLGPNGAGKTTLIRLITAYLAPSAGSIRVCGHDSVEAGDLAKRSLGYLPESAPLYPEMSVDGYLRFRARIFGIPRRDRQQAIDVAVQRCWLTDMRTRRIGTLSKGYRQRVGLAAALLHDPEVVVLDEPTSGLDPSQIREMRELIRGLAASRGRAGRTSPTTVLLSSHILPEVEQTCDRVVIVARGCVRADGTPDELLAPLRRVAPYAVEVVGTDPDACARALQGVSGAAKVERVGMDGVEERGGERGGARFMVTPTPGAPDLRESIARAVTSAGGAAGGSGIIRELTRAHTSLEQVFLRVIEEPAGSTDSAPTTLTPPRKGVPA